MEVLNVKDIVKEGILNNISFSVQEGEFLAVMGPSGSGKSTLLYQLAGMDYVTSGEIELLGESISGFSEEKLAAVRLEKLGFVFQQMTVLSELNVIDNIMFPAVQYQKKAKKKKREEIERNARELMRKLSVEELAERRITEVSGGQLQRVCICRSMMNEPKLLFADEPTGALHRQAASEVMEALTDLNKGGVSIVMVTHDYKVASRCDRILYLEDGRIRDEMILGKYEDEKKTEREEKVNFWLGSQGW